MSVKKYLVRGIYGIVAIIIAIAIMLLLLGRNKTSAVESDSDTSGDDNIVVSPVEGGYNGTEEGSKEYTGAQLAALISLDKLQDKGDDLLLYCLQHGSILPSDTFINDVRRVDTNSIDPNALYAAFRKSEAVVAHTDIRDGDNMTPYLFPGTSSLKINVRGPYKDDNVYEGYKYLSVLMNNISVGDVQQIVSEEPDNVAVSVNNRVFSNGIISSKQAYILYAAELGYDSSAVAGQNPEYTAVQVALWDTNGESDNVIVDNTTTDYKVDSSAQKVLDAAEEYAKTVNDPSILIGQEENVEYNEDTGIWTTGHFTFDNVEGLNDEEFTKDVVGKDGKTSLDNALGSSLEDVLVVTAEGVGDVSDKSVLKKDGEGYYIEITLGEGEEITGNVKVTGGQFKALYVAIGAQWVRSDSDSQLYATIYEYNTEVIDGVTNFGVPIEKAGQWTNIRTSYQVSIQNMLVVNLIHKAWIPYKWELTFIPGELPPDEPPEEEPPEEEPPEPKENDLKMAIEGYVWLEGNDSKEGNTAEVDGIMDDGEDKVEKVKVSLYSTTIEGNASSGGDNGPEGDDVLYPQEENERLDNGAEPKEEGLIETVYTNENGFYHFEVDYDDPTQDERTTYYVQFEYNGQIYKPTIYLAENGKEGKLDGEEGYKQDPNNKKYDKNSKAKEDVDRTEMTRAHFNEQFTDIFGKQAGSGGEVIGKATDVDPLKYKLHAYGEAKDGRNVAIFESTEGGIDASDAITEGKTEGPAVRKYKNNYGDKLLKEFKIQAATEKNYPEDYRFEKYIYAEVHAELEDPEAVKIYNAAKAMEAKASSALETSLSGLEGIDIENIDEDSIEAAFKAKIQKIVETYLAEAENYDDYIYWTNIYYNPSLSGNYGIPELDSIGEAAQKAKNLLEVLEKAQEILEAAETIRDNTNNPNNEDDILGKSQDAKEAVKDNDKDASYDEADGFMDEIEGLYFEIGEALSTLESKIQENDVLVEENKKIEEDNRKADIENDANAWKKDHPEIFPYYEDKPKKDLNEVMDTEALEKAIEAYKEEKEKEDKDKDVQYDFIEKLKSYIPTKFEYFKEVHLGLQVRKEPDLAVHVDLLAAGTSIKGKKKLITFKANTRKDALDAGITLSENDFNASPEIEQLQKLSQYDLSWGPNGSPDYEDIDKLQVYALYKVTVTNQGNIKVNLKELATQFSDTLEYIGAAGDVHKGIAGYIFGEKYLADVDKWESGDKGLTATESKELEADGEDLSLYLVFRVKDPNAALNSQIQVMTEVKKYSTANEFEEADQSGQIDRDSAPGSAKFGERKTYEDDTDDAPILKLQLADDTHSRKIKGEIFDDINGDGVKDGGEAPVLNAKVVVYERIYQLDSVRNATNKENYGVKQIERLVASDGNYSVDVSAGDYEVEFIYGYTEMLNSNRKYNAQDYQSTFYTSVESAYDDEDFVTVFAGVDGMETSSEPALNMVPETKSGAKDDIEIRADVMENAVLIQYEKGILLNSLSGEGELDGTLAGRLSGGNNGTEKNSDSKPAKSKYQNSETNPNYTYMQAYSEKVEVVSNDIRGKDIVINFGIKERPKTSLVTDKKAARIRIVTNDGVSIIDTDDVSKVENLREFPHADGEDYKREIFLDEAIMQGARIIVDYDITVKNTGDADKISNYLSDDKDRANANGAFGSLLTTLSNTFHESIGIDSVLPVRPDIIYDYVHTNFEYRLEDNTDYFSGLWQRIYQRTTDGTNLAAEDETINTLLWEEVRNKIKDGIDLGNGKNTKVVSNIVKADSTGVSTYNLLPETEMTEKIQMSMSLAAAVEMETQGEDFLYKNAMEIVQRSSGAGRRDYEAVPGNDTPYEKNAENPHEPDYSDTKDIVVRTPDGGIIEQKENITALIAFAAVASIIVASLGTVGITIYDKKHM